MSRQHATAILERFGTRFEIDGLTYDQDGCCCMEIDDLTVNLEVTDDGILFLHSPLGDVRAKDRDALFTRLLTANLQFQETAGGVLGYDESANAIVLSMQTPTAVLEDDVFEQILENFVNVAATWRGRIQGFEQQSEADDVSALSMNDAGNGLRV